MALKWEICDSCEGDGKSSAYLGSFTRDEFDEHFDAEEADDYFAGRYDRRCEDCDGSGKVQTPGCELPAYRTIGQFDNAIDALERTCSPCATVYARWEIEHERQAEMAVGA